MAFYIIGLWIICVFMVKDHVVGAAVPCRARCGEPQIDNGNASLLILQSANNSEANNGNNGPHVIDKNGPALYDADTNMTVQCNESYWFRGTYESTGTIRCGCQGQWSPTDIRCDCQGQWYPADVRCGCQGQRYPADDEACVKDTTPTCQRPLSIVDALDPPDKAYYDNERFRYTCRRGYWRKGGSAFRKCNATTGTWEVTGFNKRPMRCELVDCGHPRSIPNANEVLLEDKNTRFEAEVKYNCKTGYSRKNGRERSVCQEDGTWSWTYLECDIGCRMPSHASNLHVVHPNDGNPPFSKPFDKYINHNESVKVSCASGFVFNSTQTNTKVATQCVFGAWTLPVFDNLCVQAPCALSDWQKAGELVRPTNTDDKFRIPGRVSDYVFHEATVEVTCTSTYYIAKWNDVELSWRATEERFKRITCTRARWTPSKSEISCHPKPCEELPKYEENLSNVNYSTDAIDVSIIASTYYIYGTKADITCLERYETRTHESTSQLTCNERSWNTASPICKPRECRLPTDFNQTLLGVRPQSDYIAHDTELSVSCPNTQVFSSTMKSNPLNTKCEYGDWSDETVFRDCEPAPCNKLDERFHELKSVTYLPGVVQVLSEQYVRHGTHAVYTCDPRYENMFQGWIQCDTGGYHGLLQSRICEPTLFTFDDPEELAGNFGQLFDKMNETDDLDTATGRHIDRIASDGLDITFLIDSSGSIARRDFKQIIRFIKLFAEKVDVSNRSNGAQFAALSFGESPGEDFGKNNGFHTEPRSLEEVKGLLGGLKYSSGGTNIRGALVYFKQNMLPHNLRKRASAKQYLFIFSDGNYNQGGNPTIIASDLRADMVEIFSVKIGSNEIKTGEAKTNTNLLITLSSEEDLNDNIADPDPHFFHLQHYATLGYLVQELLKGSIDYSECGVAGKTGITLGNIIGGNIAQPRAWPWMVAVTEAQANNVKMREHKQLCGGTLLDNEWILTAAHCFKGRTYNNPRRVMVKLGANNMTQVGENNLKVRDVEVRSMHIHEGWSANNTRRANDKNTNWANDIALLRLNSKINFSNSVRPICLINKTTHDEVIQDKIAVVTGWGITGNESLSARQPGGKRLRQVRLPVVTHVKDPQRCNSRFPAEKFICAGSERRADSCTGDSGGPLMIELGAENNKPRWYQIGIVSNGVGCAQPDTYGKYTDIRRYRDWIEDTINNAGQ